MVELCVNLEIGSFQRFVFTLIARIFPTRLAFKVALFVCLLSFQKSYRHLEFLRFHLALGVSSGLFAEPAANHKRPRRSLAPLVVSLHVPFHPLPKVGLVRALTTLESFDFVMDGLFVNRQTLCFLGLELADVALKNFTSFHRLLAMVESYVTFQVHLFESLVVTVDASVFHLFFW